MESIYQACKVERPSSINQEKLLCKLLNLKKKITQGGYICLPEPLQNIYGRHARLILLLDDATAENQLPVQKLLLTANTRHFSRVQELIPFPGRFCSFQGSKTVPFVIPAKAGIQLFGG